MILFNCCSKGLCKTTSKKYCKKDEYYTLGFICDRCGEKFGPKVEFYHCRECGRDTCVYCSYLTEDESESSDSDG